MRGMVCLGRRKTESSKIDRRDSRSVSNFSIRNDKTGWENELFFVNRFDYNGRDKINYNMQEIACKEQKLLIAEDGTKM